MIPQLLTTQSQDPLYCTIQKAIQAQKSSTGRKPSLVQINRQDYGALANQPGLGLSIDNVNVISFMDVERGSFIFLP